MKREAFTLFRGVQMMKRIVLALFVVGVAFLPVAAQDPPGPAAGRPVVAVINVGVIFTKYERAREHNKEITASMKGPRAEHDKLNRDMKAWQEAAKADPAARDALEEKILQAKRQMEDLNRKITALVRKRQEDALMLLWKDAQDEVAAYAREHGLQAVFAYGDPVAPLILPANVQRKLQAVDAGSSFPFYVAPGVDISEAIVDRLNRRYAERAKTATP